jgi:hypothetical protein
MKTIITKVENNRVIKFLDVSDENAQTELDGLLKNYPNAFIYDGEYSRDLWVENGKVSIVEFIEQVAIPNVVTMRQARLALLGADLLDDVNSVISSLPSPQKEVAQVEWEYAQDVQRNQPLVLMLLPALGLTDEEADQLFIKAAKL